MSAIARLPEELLLHILSFLDRPAPSVISSGEVPTAESLFRPHPSHKPIKQCSLISRLWRRLCAPLLFKHLIVPLQTILPPVHYCPHVGRCTHAASTPISWSTQVTLQRSPQEAELDALIACAEAYDMSRFRPSLTIYQFSPCSNIAPLGHSTLHELWRSLFSALSPRTLTIIATPKNLGELCNREVDLSDSWAFKIALQRIDMSTSPNDSAQALAQHGVLGHGTSTQPSHYSQASHRSGANSHQYTANTYSEPSPLTLLPWTHLTYHGGSCLPVFGEYHYFEKRPPCLLSCTLLQPNGGFVQSHPVDFTSEPRNFHVPWLGQNLTTLTYAAVFPHLIHIQALVKAIMGTTTTATRTALAPAHPPEHCLQNSGYSITPTLPNLTTLDLRLTPAPGSRELDDLDLIGRGNLNLRDCWAEVERSYAVLVSMCRRAGLYRTSPATDGERGRGVVDWSPSWETLAGGRVGSELDLGVEEVGGGGGDGVRNGMVERPRVLPRFRTFVSRDVEAGVLEEELESIFTAFAPGWVRGGGGSGVWTRKEEYDEAAGSDDVFGPMPWETT